MLTRCIALFVLFSVVAVRGQEGTKAATYTRDLEQESVNGRCVGVTDGDTINVLILGKQQIKVRLAFVDAPERGQAFGQRAKQDMSGLVFGKDVRLRPHTIDPHGRLVARVVIDNQDVGLELLKEGLCWVCEKYAAEAPPENQTSYWAARAAPQSDKIGLWQDPGPVSPWEWRKERRRRAELPS